MGNRVVDIRLTGKWLFVYYHKKIGIGDDSIKCGGCTNQRILSKRTGLSEGFLMGIFTRKGFNYYDDGDIVIMKLDTSAIEKGKQSMARRGRGGMEKFVSRYVIKRSTEY
jgi:hypothetical protein